MGRIENITNTVYHAARDAVVALRTAGSVQEIIDDGAAVSYGFGSCAVETIARGWIRIPSARRDAALTTVMTALGASDPTGWAIYMSDLMAMVPDEGAIGRNWPYVLPPETQSAVWDLLPQIEFDRRYFMLSAARGIALAHRVERNETVWYAVSAMRCFVSGVLPNPFHEHLGMLARPRGGRWI